MTTTIEATYIDGKFLPANAVSLLEGERVKLTFTNIEPITSLVTRLDRFSWEVDPPTNEPVDNCLTDELFRQRRGE